MRAQSAITSRGLQFGPVTLGLRSRERHEQSGPPPTCPCGRLAHREYVSDAQGRRLRVSVFRCDRCPR